MLDKLTIKYREDYVIYLLEILKNTQLNVERDCPRNFKWPLVNCVINKPQSIVSLIFIRSFY